MSEIDYIQESSRIEVDENSLNNAKVKVFGVGGAGGNTVNRMVQMNISGVEYYAVNTDAKALDISLAHHKIAIGKRTTNNLGAGMKPEIGRKAVEENIDDLREAMKGADMVFITAGMGGGTGTGAAPVVGSIARELGILTVAVVTKPFKFEGKRRLDLAAEGIKNLRNSVDTVIVVDNAKLLNVIEKNMTLDDSFKVADEILGNAVSSICDIMFKHGLIHVDFADIKTVMTNGGSALMGTGIAEGENRGIKAVDMALSSPLLEDINIEGATGVVVNVSHGENFSMLEFNEAMEHIHEAVSDRNDPNIIMGDILIPELGEKVRITIVATGCGGASQVAPMFTQENINREVRPAPAAPAPANDLFVRPEYRTASQPIVSETPVVASPRPMGMDFASVAKTVAMPKVAEPVSTFTSSQFDATTTALDEEIVHTATATLPETQEVPEIAEADRFSSGSYETPSINRQTIKPEVDAAPKAEESSFKGSDPYEQPAYLRLGGEF